MCPTNFTDKSKTLFLSLYYNRENSYLFVNGTEIIKFKPKVPEIIFPGPLCLGNISKYWLVDNMKKTRLNRYVYEYSIDYDAIAFDHILDIRKYLMEKKRYKNIWIY